MSETHPIEEGKVCSSNGAVHFILSHSYLVFYMAVVFGAIFHMIFHFQFLSGELYPYIGFGMIVIGSIIIYWAQYSSAQVRTLDCDRTVKDFEHGPYKYTRNPTHIGMMIMTLGLGVVLNSLFTILFVIVTIIITKILFLNEEERLLEEKYGEPYRTYKKKVGTWI